MRIGVPRELKNHECRVGLTPPSVAELTALGHEVWIETRAGAAVGFNDEDYQAVGARIAQDGPAVYTAAELVVKVKEPLAEERVCLNAGHCLFAFLHLAPDPVQTAELMASGATCIAYETVTAEGGRLPLLAPTAWSKARVAAVCCSVAYRACRRRG